MKQIKYNRSPLRYSGGKYKLLSQILPLFPDNINIFVDVFGGGGDVSINVNAKHKIYNDKSWQISNLLSAIKHNNKFKEDIESFIENNGLSKENKQAYSNLRELYNCNCKWTTLEQSKLLFLLICYSFNHMIQFNSKGEFNVPCGFNRSSYNKSIAQDLSVFQIMLQDINIENKDYKDIINEQLLLNNSEDLFFYLDPDYSISDSSYRRCSELKWTQQDDVELFNRLDYIDLMGGKFAMSNVTELNGKENITLKKWLAKRNYVCYNLDMDYKNCNYQRKNKGVTKEVLITNY